MKVGVKYNAMNNYTREIFTPIPGNFNGDTDIRLYISIRSAFNRRRYSCYCDISEDQRMDEQDTNPETTPFAIKDEEILPMLYNPLPADLLTPNKDLLILTAALFVRDIYNKTMFAKWCSLQTSSIFQSDRIKPVIHARFIMNSGLSHVTLDTPGAELSCLIWYPSIPQKSVLREFFRRQPMMKPIIAGTCIIADYKALHALLDADLDIRIMKDAHDSLNPHYIQDLETNVPQRGYKSFCRRSLCEFPRKLEIIEHPPSCLRIKFTDSGPDIEEDGLSYSGNIPKFGGLQLSVSAQTCSSSMSQRIIA
ncbi:uncharacterized protein N7479_009778 [Penicillium vulpinum]|nr:uncharacterized protein N7479_009778 [Penicillium vulpinum]KAJ5951365.1 hypothetical protein N7479_009778 [Penicillium vulpinum]